MKLSTKKIATILSFVFITTIGFSQIGIGVKAGRNLSSANIEGLSILTPSTEMISATNASVFVNIPLLNGFSFQPEIGFHENGFILKEEMDLNILNIPVPIGASAHTRLNHIQIPLLAQYEFGKGIVGGFANIGPYLNYAVSGNLKTKAHAIIEFNVTDSDINLKNDNFQRFGGGVKGGAGIWLKAGRGRIIAEGFYQQSMTDSFADPIIDIKLKNKSFGFNLGYVYTFKQGLPKA